MGQQFGIFVADLSPRNGDNRGILYKKLCTCRGNGLQGHWKSLQLLLLARLGRIRVPLPVSGLLLQHLYLSPFPRD